ncbi:hypothetical protein [Streptomyces sp. NPDC059176]|uniref:hypothetical protein n=1 Tax=unclassified Streptomyces TaxID=2593676 RepID=UPI0036CC1C1F
MAEHRATAASHTDGRPLERALRAHADTASLNLLQAYRDFIAHSETCTGSCPHGVDCDEAAGLREAWRTARQHAAH